MQQWETLNRNRDFQRAYSRGKYAVHPLIITYAVKNRLGVTRLGITASRKVGGAVQRNRARRVIRAALQQLEGNWYGGYDIVLVARARTVEARPAQLEGPLARQLQKLELLAP